MNEITDDQLSRQHTFVRSTLKHHGISEVHTALVADLIYGLKDLNVVQAQRQAGPSHLDCWQARDEGHCNPLCEPCNTGNRAGCLYKTPTAPQPAPADKDAEIAPLTNAEKSAMFKNENTKTLTARQLFLAGVAGAERHYGITQPAQADNRDAEIAALRQDAERYREFRTGKALAVKCGGVTIFHGSNPDYERKYPEALDAALDAAIAQAVQPRAECCHKTVFEQCADCPYKKGER